MQFTLKIEKENKLNFLDFSLTKNVDEKKFEFDIYRKPTTTDLVIPADSHHPRPQKMASFNAFVHRLLTIPLSDENFKKEVNTIKHIATSNGYNSSIVKKLINKHQSHKNDNNNNTTGTKYVSATYGNFTPYILVNTLKKCNINVGFKTNNKLSKLLRDNNKVPLEDKSGVYKLLCNDCDSFYIGQTGRKFSKRYPEHVPPMCQDVDKKRTKYSTYTASDQDIDKKRSNFAKHLLSEKHYCTNLEENMTPLFICEKGPIMDAHEEFEIYRAFKDSTHKGNILNDQLKFNSNTLYNIAIKYLNYDINYQ